MALAGKQKLLVRNLQGGQPRPERVSESDRDDGVGVAVNDEGGWKAGVGLGVVRGYKAARDVDDGTDSGVWLGPESEREEGAQRDAYQGDAARINARLRADVGESIADGGQPEWNVGAVRKHGGSGSVGSGAVEVVDSIDEHTKPGEHGRDAVEPEADTAAGAVQEDDGGVRSGRGGPGDMQADGFAAAEEGFHGWF